jgi:hypothetical protein
MGEQERSPDVRIAEIDARLQNLEQSIPDKIDLRVSQAELKLHSANSETDGEVRHVKGQLSMLTTGGVLTFLLASGG